MGEGRVSETRSLNLLTSPLISSERSYTFQVGRRVVQVGVVIDVADAVESAALRKSSEEARPGKAGACQVDDEAVQSPDRAEVGAIAFGWLQKTAA
jgi:hypothetical protein